MHPVRRKVPWDPAGLCKHSLNIKPAGACSSLFCPAEHCTTQEHRQLTGKTKCRESSTLKHAAGRIVTERSWSKGFDCATGHLRLPKALTGVSANTHTYMQTWRHPALCYTACQPQPYFPRQEAGSFQSRNMICLSPWRLLRVSVPNHRSKCRFYAQRSSTNSHTHIHSC